MCWKTLSISCSMRRAQCIILWIDITGCHNTDRRHFNTATNTVNKDKKSLVSPKKSTSFLHLFHTTTSLQEKKRIYLAATDYTDFAFSPTNWLLMMIKGIEKAQQSKQKYFSYLRISELRNIRNPISFAHLRTPIKRKENIHVQHYFYRCVSMKTAVITRFQLEVLSL